MSLQRLFSSKLCWQRHLFKRWWPFYKPGMGFETCQHLWLGFQRCHYLEQGKIEGYLTQGNGSGTAFLNNIPDLSQRYCVNLGWRHRVSSNFCCFVIQPLPFPGKVCSQPFHLAQHCIIRFFANLSLRACDPESLLFYWNTQGFFFRQEPWLMVFFTAEASRRAVPGHILLQCLVGLSV